MGFRVSCLTLINSTSELEIEPTEHLMRDTSQEFRKQKPSDKGVLASENEIVFNNEVKPQKLQKQKTGSPRYKKVPREQSKF